MSRKFETQGSQWESNGSNLVSRMKGIVEQGLVWGLVEQGLVELFVTTSSIVLISSIKLISWSISNAWPSDPNIFCTVM